MSCKKGAYLKSIGQSFALAAMLIAGAIQARADIVMFSTQACFGAFCTPASVSSVTGSGTSVVTFQAQASTTVNTSTPSGLTSADLGQFSVSGIGTFGSTPFTLRVSQTSPTPGTGSFAGTLSGTLIANGSDVRIAFGSTAFVIGGIRYQLVNLTGGTTLKMDPNSTGGVTRITADIMLNSTAADAEVRGRVRQENGISIANATVWMTGGQGSVCFARSNPFGYYRFSQVPIGETYIVEARHKRFLFEPQVLTVLDTITDYNLIGRPMQ